MTPTSRFPHAPARRAQRGLSLVELIVAIAISVTVMSGVVQVLVVSKSNFTAERELATLQENARFALKYLSEEIRMSGNSGCLADTPTANSIRTAGGPYWYVSGLGIQGYENSAGTSTYPADFRANVAANTDAIAVRRGEYTGIRVTALTPAANPLTVDTQSFTVGEPVIVARPDCGQLGIFQISGPFNATQLGHATGTAVPGNCVANITGAFTCRPSGTPVTIGTATSVAYPVGSTILKLRSEAYYIRASASDATIPSLYRQRMLVNGTTYTLYTTAEELVQGVENMQVLYGVDSANPINGLADRYLNATQVGAANKWGDVVTVRITMRLRTLAPVYNTNTAYGVFEGVTGTSGSDRFMRQTVSTTIKVRNN